MMGYEVTREAVLAYIGGGKETRRHDRDRLAEDAVFTLVSTGKDFEGRAAVERLLDLFYGQAFDGRDEPQTFLVDGDFGVVEAIFAGKHIGEFDGVAATGKQVETLYCAVYKVEEGKIKTGHLYLDVHTLRAQLTGEKP